MHRNPKPNGELRREDDISSELSWEEVSLPPSVSEADLDGIIFAQLKPRAQKVALVVGKATVRCQELGLPISSEMIAARLQALANSDLIEGYGDLRVWRFSEVCLPADPDPLP
jgi:hypothetical protein